MKIYRVNRTQLLNISIDEAWHYFSSPENLKEITPEHMRFEIKFMTGGDQMYAGQLINYRVNVLPYYRVKWTTEITHVEAPFRLIDEQRFGPYAMWHHEHRFTTVENGTLMEDEISYAVPFGFLGTIANYLFVRKEVESIFDYRYEVLEKKFNH